MIFWHHVLSFTVLCLWHVQAAPQKRGCHNTTTSYDLGTNSTLPTDVASDTDTYTYTYSPDALLTTTPLPTPTPFDTDANINNDAASPLDAQTTLTQLLTLGSITPKILLIYTNSTRTLLPTSNTPVTNISTRVLYPNTTFFPSSTITPVPTYTTPDMSAMQTAYYHSVCGWEQHTDHAICLGNNTMLCCRADNERCSPILMDGGLSCDGVESGNWATVWARKTVTLGVGAESGTVTAGAGADAVTTDTAGDATTSLPDRIAFSSDGAGGGGIDSITLESVESVATHVRITVSADSSTSTSTSTSTNTVYSSSSGRVRVVPVDQR